MKIANRLNSFKDEKYHLINDPKLRLEYLFKKAVKLKGITHVDLNYPDHFQYHTVKEIKDFFSKYKIGINGTAIRFYSYQEFQHGAFSNPQKEIREFAIQETKKIIDITEQLGASVVTIWPGQDGYEVPFQINYEEVWNYEVVAFKKICKHNSNIKISLEYKPHEPRINGFFYSGGITLDFISDVGEKNLGVTIDLAHSLASNEKTALILSRILQKKLLFGIHINDGYGKNDDGLPLGSVNFITLLECMYLLRKFNYNGVLYIDSDPKLINATTEFNLNVKTLKKIKKKLSQPFISQIEKTQKKQSIAEAIKLLHKLL